MVLAVADVVTFSSSGVDLSDGPATTITGSPVFTGVFGSVRMRLKFEAPMTSMNTCLATGRLPTLHFAEAFGFSISNTSGGPFTASRKATVCLLVPSSSTVAKLFGDRGLFDALLRPAKHELAVFNIEVCDGRCRCARR